MYTWKDLKLASLQKMFSANGTTIPTDSSTRDYIASMPYAANEAMQMIATAGKYFTGELVIEKEDTERTKYNLSELTDGAFYEIEDAYYDNGDIHSEIKLSLEHGNIYLSAQGTYTIYYDAYAPTITEETADDFEIDLPPEVLVILPLYIASQLYKDDDNAIATTYRNEFEVAFERLKNNSNDTTLRFTSESGWI